MARSKKKKQNEELGIEEVVQQAPVKTASTEKTSSKVRQALLLNYSKVTLKRRGLI